MPREERQAGQPPHPLGLDPRTRHAGSDGRQCAVPATSPAPGGRQPLLPVSAPRYLKSRKRQCELPGARHGWRPQVRTPEGGMGRLLGAGPVLPPVRSASLAGIGGGPGEGRSPAAPRYTPAPLLAGQGSTLRHNSSWNSRAICNGVILFFFKVFVGFLVMLVRYFDLFFIFNGRRRGRGTGWVGRTLPFFSVIKTKAK